MRLFVLSSLLLTTSAASAIEWPIYPEVNLIAPITGQQSARCLVLDNALRGNYVAIQTHPYQQNCVIRTDASRLAPQLVPLGRSSTDGLSRVALGSDNSIVLSLGGARDNTLAGGKRGRQEVANCFLPEAEVARLSSEERDFRFAAADMARNCAQASSRYAAYSFDLMLDDTPTTPAATWDALIMQLHSVDDKDRYCIPNNPAQPQLCNQHNGALGKSRRNAAAYQAMADNGAVFEGSIQPPLNFRVKAGYFSITASSSLRDPNGHITPFSSKKACSVRVNEIPVGQVNRCNDTGKTITVLYRAPLQAVLPPLRYTRFKVQVKWPTTEDPTSTVRVETLDNDNKVSGVLVNDSTAPLGAIDDQFPYFKAGIYRQNGNTVTTNVRLANLRNLHHWQNPNSAAIRDWAYDPQRSVVGEVYEYANPYNGDTEYFELKALAANGRYAYFPINKTSNGNWAYLGLARQWGQNGWTAPIGSMFIYANPYTGFTEFFRLRALGSNSRYGYFPTDQTDNEHWTYLGTRG